MPTWSLAFLCFLAQVQDPGPEPVAPGAAPEGGGVMQLVVMLTAGFAIMYFLMIRPQKQQETQEKDMLGKLKKNDHVVTKGGMHGIVMNVKDDEVTLKIDEQQNVKVRFQKNAIAAILGEDDKSKTEEKKA